VRELAALLDRDMQSTLVSESSETVPTKGTPSHTSAFFNLRLYTLPNAWFTHFLIHGIRICPN
jgi:hypothetical protein